MTRTRNKFLKIGALLLTFLLLFAAGGCGQSKASAGEPQTSAKAEDTQENTEADDGGQGDSSEQPEENLPDYYHKNISFQPIADGQVTEENEGVKLDLSHIDQGYFMAAYTGEAQKLLIQVEGSDAIPYRYYLSGDGTYSALPLTAGNGSYAITACESVGDDRYAVIFSKDISVELENSVIPFLYSNQYVNFDENTEAVALAKELTEGKDELEAVQAVYDYVTSHVTYDDEKAQTVQSGYLPDVDETLSTGKGICFDYAALMTAMLRSSGIPTRLDIGYATDVYHAWISTYLEEQGLVDNIIKFDGETWTLMDPTFASDGDDGIEEFITDSSNYNLEYVH